MSGVMSSPEDTSSASPVTDTSVSPLTPTKPLRHRSSSFSSIKSRISATRCKCSKCPVWCWFERAYRHVSTKKAILKSDKFKLKEVKVCPVEAGQRLQVNKTPADNNSSFSVDDNLSWDASADFLDSFQGSTFRTLNVMDSRNYKCKEPWIAEEEEDFLDISDDKSLLSWSSSQVRPVIIRGRTIPDPRHRVSVGSFPMEGILALPRVATPSPGATRKPQHKRLESLKVDVAEVRSQIEEALRLCKTVELGLKDIRSSSSEAIDSCSTPKASWITRNRRSEWFTEGTKTVFRDPDDPCPVCCPVTGKDSKWDKHTFVQHRVFVEEMKYHFRWQQGLGNVFNS